MKTLLSVDLERTKSLLAHRQPLDLLLLLVVFIGSTACSKSAGKASGPLPGVKIGDVSQPRQRTASAFRFYVDLSASSTQSVSVNYSTVAGTAKEITDFTAVTGTLTFQPGQTELYIDVPVTGDSLRKDDQQFYVQLTGPVNCTLSTARATGTLGNTDGTWLPTDGTGYTTPLSYPGYNLIWHDEFDGNALNTQTWNYEQGGSGWGNHELENYTSRLQNVFVSAGNLIIEARKESYGGNDYTSGRLTTYGKQQFTYGRIDIRAKLPVSKGMWPALWMLGSNISTVPWPACGETDIMELIGTYPSRVVGSMHWKQQDGSTGTYNNAYNLSSQDFSHQFHVFSIIWKQDSLQFLVDDNVYVSGSTANVTSGTYPFNSPFFFIFNVAVGGDWPGPPDGTTVFPQRMFVDYVRVFQ